MRLPKRIPWSNLAELAQLYSWIYEDGLTSKGLAVTRLAAWKASTALPQALESALSILVVILQDETVSSSRKVPTSTLTLRQSYSLSLIRLVNGLVDPLQQGAYARPIASIAAQIGLPLWLVELRHSSTHEELPSLELLREGARDAMLWLQRNYFLPTISPENQPPDTSAPLSSVSPLLTQYKRLLKMTTRDAALKSRSKPKLARILRDVENWIMEAKVAATMVSFGTQEGEDGQEQWALEHLCDALVGRGGLVPVSKRKRPTPSRGLSLPTPSHVAVWSPLILHVHSRYTIFPSILLGRLISHILSPSQAVPSASASASAYSADATYDHTLATWALWIVNRWGDEPGTGCEWVDVVKALLLGFGQTDRQSPRALVTALTESDARLKESVTLLSQAMQSSSRISAWEAGALDIMSARLSALGPDLKAPSLSIPDSGHAPEDIEMSMPNHISPHAKMATGWRLLEEIDGWKPCPIGICTRLGIDTS